MSKIMVCVMGALVLVGCGNASNEQLGVIVNGSVVNVGITIPAGGNAQFALTPSACFGNGDGTCTVPDSVTVALSLEPVASAGWATGISATFNPSTAKISKGVAEGSPTVTLSAAAGATGGLLKLCAEDAATKERGCDSVEVAVK